MSTAVNATRSGRTWGRWAVAAAVVLAAVLAYQWAGLGQWLTLDQLKASRDALIALHEQRPLATVVAYFAVYVLFTALSIPGAAILTLAGGAVLGLGLGLLVVSFASSLGALIAFLAARTLLRGVVEKRFGTWLATVNAGLAKDGTFYLLTLRLVPVFPFFLINLLMGLTTISAWRFYIVSQIGMLVGTAVYVNAGTQLANITSTADILSPGLLGSLALLGVFPWLAKGAVGLVQRRKLYARWPRPARFDRNLVVIGGGAGGLVSAYIAAAVKAKVTLIEGHKMGGDCLNFGCVPSKALIRSAKAAKQLRQADKLGLRGVTGEVDFAAVMARVHQVIRDIEPHDSVERYTGLGVEVLMGHARITSPWQVDVTLADG
ncbi:MAG: VTT domain-containing protein, partial [Hydrogenophaga sp.]|nr:VTT domain-containing protein [Hydrogenophaga sp.]